MDRKKKAITLSVHRCRFVDYAPSAITALAYPPLPLPSVKGKKRAQGGKQPFIFGLLAVGHANGDIDICEWTGGKGETQSSQAWVVRKTLPGLYPSKVDSLAFAIRYPDDLGPDDVPTQAQLRLFSSGGGTDLIEWDLNRGCIRRTITSQGGSIWSIAVNPSCSSLALGCEDGTVRILSVADDTLTHSRRFDRVKCRMLSIAWGPPVPRQYDQKPPPPPATGGGNESSDSDEDDEDEWTDSWLVTGDSDSSLRKWDVATGRVIDRMGLEKMHGERTLVWTVGVLGDGTIVSGDSLGMVKFWDSRTCTQLSSFQAHGADVLCMTIGPDGKSLYTSGVDQKTVQFSLVKTTTSNWTQTASKRMHSHDVRALTIWPPYTPLPGSYKRHFPLDIAPILVSGGLDMLLVLAPAASPTSTVMKVVNPLDTSVEATFEDSYHRRVSYPIIGKVKVARGARLVSCVREAGLSVWRIAKKAESESEVLEEKYGVDADVDEEPFSGGWERILEMDLNVHSNIIAHEISDDGRWLVVSDLFESKLFSLRTNETGQSSIKRIKDFETILRPHIPASTNHPRSTGSSSVRFTPDSSKLVLCTVLSSYVLVIDLAVETPKVLRQFEHHRIKDLSKSGRLLRGKLAAAAARKEANKGRPKVNGHVTVNGDDVEMGEPDSPPDSGKPNGLEESEESEMEGVHNTSDSDEDEDEDNTAIVSIDRIAISADGQWLATSDSHSRTHIFNLDSISHHTTLPTMPLPVQCLAFDPMRPSVLLLVFPDHSVQIYDVETRQFPAWGKDLAESLPRRFINSHEVVLGAEFDPYEPAAKGVGGEEKEGDGKTRYILFWGSTWIFKASLDTRAFVRSNKKKRRRRDEEDETTTHDRPVEGDELEEEERQWRDFKMITHYRPILCCDFLSKDELVVVERPSMDVLMSLPPAYFRHKYGS